jgi:DNA transformation protein
MSRAAVHRSRPALAALPGLGPASAALLARAGVHDAATLRSRDVFDLYAELKRLEPSTSLNLLYALIGACENIDWRAIARERRTAILLELDARQHPGSRLR